MTKQYDYIIVGAGCAGLSLLYRMLLHPTLCQKHILVIEASIKNQNDRTWCFWEKKPDVFESIVVKHWDEVIFKSKSFASTLNLSPYRYKMIEGLSLYNCVLEKAKAFSNVTFIQEKVVAVTTSGALANVELLDGRCFAADWVFNTVLLKPPTLLSHQYYLKQHFTGWVIETKVPMFNPAVATLMDFTVSQQHGTTFMYVMPMTSTKALIEYTLFTEDILPKEFYAQALQAYIQDMGMVDYTIQHEEFGVIPMTNVQFPQQEGSVVYLGTAGGDVKASSGYAFKFIQKRTAYIVQQLAEGSTHFVDKGFSKRKFALYDSVLLGILQQKRLNGDEIFTDIFSGNTPSTVFQFLDNESHLLQDMAIMKSVATRVFLPAAIRELWHLRR